MSLFNPFKKAAPAPKPADAPYNDSSANYIYNLLFCDNLDLYKQNTKEPPGYPFSLLFSETSSPADLQKIVDDGTMDPRIKVLACNKLLAGGNKLSQKTIFAVIVEVGLEKGLDTLASFSNGTARYINQTGKILIWETTDATSTELTNQLFSNSRNIVEKIGAWDKPRRPHPEAGLARISFLVSDGLYFGEAQINDLFTDPLAGPALDTAAKLMQYITEKALAEKK